MKTLFTCLTIFLCINSASAQIQFPIDVLGGLCDYSLREFEDYMHDKSYYKDNDVTNATLTYYRSNQLRSNNKSDQCSMYRSVSKPVTINISFSTTDRDYYSVAQRYLQREGFTEGQTQTVNMLNKDVPWHYYSNKKFTVIIYNYTQLDNVVWYCVQVMKNPQ